MVFRLKDCALARLDPPRGGPFYVRFGLVPFPIRSAHSDPGGHRLREVVTIWHKHSARIVPGITKLKTMRDINEVTAILAAKFVREIASSMP